MIDLNFQKVYELTIENEYNDIYLKILTIYEIILMKLKIYLKVIMNEMKTFDLIL